MQVRTQLKTHNIGPISPQKSCKMSSSTVTNSQKYPRYLLQLILSCRKITAQVSDTASAGSSTIVALASSSKQDFYSHYHSKLNPFPKRHRFWDSNTVVVVGQKLGSQLREIGIDNVMINLAEELSRPANQRIMVLPLFDSVRRAGVVVDGLEKLAEDRVGRRLGFCHNGRSGL